MISPQKYKAARVSRGTQAEVAAQLHVDTTTISRRERGEREIPYEAWLALVSLPFASRAGAGTNTGPRARGNGAI